MALTSGVRAWLSARNRTSGQSCPCRIWRRVSRLPLAAASHAAAPISMSCCASSSWIWDAITWCSRAAGDVSGLPSETRWKGKEITSQLRALQAGKQSALDLNRKIDRNLTQLAPAPPKSLTNSHHSRRVALLFTAPQFTASMGVETKAHECAMMSRTSLPQREGRPVSYQQAASLKQSLLTATWSPQKSFQISHTTNVRCDACVALTRSRQLYPFPRFRFHFPFPLTTFRL